MRGGDDLQQGYTPNVEKGLPIVPLHSTLVLSRHIQQNKLIINGSVICVVIGVDIRVLVVMYSSIFLLISKFSLIGDTSDSGANRQY